MADPLLDHPRSTILDPGSFHKKAREQGESARDHKGSFAALATRAQARNYGNTSCKPSTTSQVYIASEHLILAQ
jgi:hypothetical protein